ncbi:MAG: hypothetical protein JNL92_20425 [Opitutaceae bacterium]|nr:hypothetical protein [Opitutaceae bacterium]
MTSLRRIPVRLLALLGAALAAGLEVRAQLAAKSPFIAGPAAGGTVAAENNPLEFRGYMETAGGIQYRLYDPAKKSGIWVKLNERNADLGVVAKQHDSAKETLTIEYQGKTLTLPVRKAKVVSSGNVAQAAPPAAAPVQSNVPAAVTQAVVLNPTPADEQRRLDAVAAEVARRRALREQAAQQQGQNAPVPGTAPQVMPLPAPNPGPTGQAAPQGYVSPSTQFETRGRGPNPVSPR